MPDEIIVDISKLRIGGKIAVETLRKGDFTIMHPDNITVVQVKASRNVVADEEEEEEEEGAVAEGGETPAAEAPAEG